MDSQHSGQLQSRMACDFLGQTVNSFVQGFLSDKRKGLDLYLPWLDADACAIRAFGRSLSDLSAG